MRVSPHTSQTLKLHGGQAFSSEAPGLRLNEWVDLVLEVEEGRMWISVNGKGRMIRDDQVSLMGRSELTFKTFAASPNRIMFDSIKLWAIE